MLFVILINEISNLKTLLLIRHAKSSWDDPELTDYERPLNERGKKDAPAMAEKLYERGIKMVKNQMWVGGGGWILK